MNCGSSIYDLGHFVRGGAKDFLGYEISEFAILGESCVEF